MSNYIITGATSGIGEVCARKLASEENRLIVIGRNTGKLESLKKDLPGKIICVEYDLNNLLNIKSLFSSCADEEFLLDGMVYCAGVDSSWPVKVNNTEMMQSIMNVNCFAFVEMCRFFYSKSVSRDGASIVAVSSLSGVLNEVGTSAYSMSKAALNSAVKTISKEFIRRSIRVNAILPGGVDTPMADRKGQIMSASKQINEETKTVNPQPLGKLTPDDVVNMIVFLLGDESRYCTGELLSISGGRAHNL